MDNSETVGTLGIRHRTKTNKLNKKSTHRKLKI